MYVLFVCKAVNYKHQVSLAKLKIAFVNQYLPWLELVLRLFETWNFFFFLLDSQWDFMLQKVLWFTDEKKMG